MLGCDEHTPGSKEGSDNRRKNMALVFIFNFVELGPDILECDASWYVPVIARAQVFKEVAWRMVGGDVEGNPAAIGEVPHALEVWCRSRSTLACA